MKKFLVAAVLAVSASSFAAPPPAAAPVPKGEVRGDKAEMQKKMHLMLVVGIAEALSLNESEALKMSDKLKGYEEKRRPVREAMHESVKTLKAAADGDTAAGAQVDAAVTRLFDSRQQMAAMDKEMFAGLSRDLNPQKRAQLAVFLARFHAEAKGFKGGKGRHHRD
jgi:Spy/CpxP family protein refolding chaperone